MTEDEARNKWCPVARVPVTWRASAPGNCSVNRFNKGTPGYSETRCIASDCMAWRVGYCGLAGKP